MIWCSLRSSRRVHWRACCRDRCMRKLQLRLIRCRLLNHRRDIFVISFCRWGVLLFRLASFCQVCSHLLMFFIFCLSLCPSSFSFIMASSSYWSVLPPSCIAPPHPHFTRNLFCISRFAHLLLTFCWSFGSWLPQFAKNPENILQVRLKFQVQTHCYTILPLSRGYLQNHISSQVSKTQVGHYWLKFDYHLPWW